MLPKSQIPKRSFRYFYDAGKTTTLPKTVQECISELSNINNQLLALTKRLNIVTGRMQHLEREEAKAKTSDSETLYASDMRCDNEDHQKMSKSDILHKARTTSGVQMISKVDMPISFSPENEIGNNDIGEMREEIENDQSSPLIIALKKLQERRGQKRGIKMWTQNLANLFYIVDTDHSGIIGQREYSQMIEKLDLSDSLKNSLREKFNNIDKDGSKGISLNEFLLFFLKFPKFKQELLQHAHSNAPYINEKRLTSQQRWRQRAYCIVECPDYNVISKILFCFDLMLTLVPVIIICIESFRPSYFIEWPKHTYMWFVSIFFAIEYFCGLLTCKHPKVFLLNYGHVLDAVSFAFWIIYKTFARKGRMDPMGFIMFRTFRLVKIHYVLKFEKLKQDLDVYMDTLKLAWTSYGAVTWLLICTIFFFSLLIYVFERGEYNEEDKTWSRDDEDVSPFSDLYGCVYFTLVTMTTLGYGDMLPKSYVGKLVSMVSVVVGLCNITFLINIIGDCFEEVFREFILKRSRKLEKEHSKYINDCVSKASRRLTSRQSRASLGFAGQTRRSLLRVRIEEMNSGMNRS